MIGWLQPGALWGLVLLAAPLLIHLLRARQADTVQFPSVRFLRASQAASVRLGRPSDVVLLALRTAIVAAAVLAMAQPLFLSKGRLHAWNAQVARAIVVDSSDSMRQPNTGGRNAAVEAVEFADAEARTASAHTRIETPDLQAGLQRAARWLTAAPPARREIVVLSDFQHGAVSESAVKNLPAGVGLRFLNVGNIPTERSVDGLTTLAAPGIGTLTQSIHLSGRETVLTLESRLAPLRAQEGGSVQVGLRFISIGNVDDEERLLRAVARAGAAAPRADRPLVVRFAPASGEQAFAPVREAWMLQTLMRVEQDSELIRIARELKAPQSPNAPSWTVLVEDGSGNSLLRAAALDRELLLDVGAPIASYFAAAVVRAALAAAHGPVASPERDVLRIPTATLSAWNRAPAPVEVDMWRHAHSSDARWLWAAAVGLMAVEGWLRSRTRAQQEDTRAAA